MSEPIQKILAQSLSASTNIVTDISVADAIQPNDIGLVKSGIVYTKLEELSTQIIENYANHIDSGSPAPFKSVQMTDIFTFNPDYLSGSIPINGSLSSHNVVSCNPYPSTIQNPTESDYTSFEHLMLNYTGYANDGSDYSRSRYFRIPSIIRTNSNRLIASFDIRWQSSKDIAQTPCNDQATGISYSDDNGVTWSQPKIAIDWLYPDYDESNPSNTHYQSGVSDPGILHDETRNVSMIFGLGGRGMSGLLSRLSSAEYGIDSFARQQLVFTWSKDDGETWSTPIAVSNKIYDNEGLSSQEWAKTYRCLFSCCSPGIQLKRQSDSSKNGMLLFPVQVHTLSPLYTESNNARTTLLVVKPTYDSNNSIIELKMHFIGGNILPSTLIGKDITGQGSDEGQICEGPNGELVFIVKGYSSVSNSANGSVSNAQIWHRIYKSTDLGQTWEVIGDYTNPDNPLDKICTKLETTTRTKPSIGYFPSLSCYVVGYTQSTNYDLRNYSILRYSTDLINWKMLYQLETITNSSYQSILQSNLKPYKIEGIFEANADGFNDRYTVDTTGNNVKGAAKQLKFYSFDFKDGQYMLERTNRHAEFGYLNTGNQYCNAVAFKPSIFSTDAVTTIKSVSFQSNDIIATNSNAWCAIYDGNDSEASCMSYTHHPTSSKNCIYTFQFISKVPLLSANEYCIRFFRTADNPTDANVPTKRGSNSQLGTNELAMRSHGSKYATDPNSCVRMYTSGNVLSGGGGAFFLQPIMSLNLA